MINLKWFKLSEKKRAFLCTAPRKTFIMAPTIVQEKRLLNLMSEFAEESDLIIVGVILDEWIPGLENGEQFKPASKEELMKILTKLNEKITQKILLLEYNYANSRYIISELKPDRIIAFNGSWKNAIHYQDFWWKAYDLGVKIESISPFSNEKSAKEYGSKVAERNEIIFEDKWPLNKRYTEEEIKEMLTELSVLSWDWTGRVGAIITKKDKNEKYKVISRGYNRVVPYNSFMLHNGSIREKEHAVSGERLELGESVHGEISALENASGKNESLEDTELWVKTFPCPYCARAIAASPIKEVKYILDYSNKYGYELFQKCGKRVQKV